MPARTAGCRGRGGSCSRLKVAAHDPQRWKDIAYLAVLSVVGFVWGTRLARSCGASRSAASRCPPGGGRCRTTRSTCGSRSTPGRSRSARRDRRRAARRSRCYCSAALALSQAHIARWLLAPSLAARVEQLTETRAGAVDAAAAELQRIERDLHDGAQARLVALAMDLGMAEERFDRDPESARELVGEAREEAKRALAELRDLARGIRPSLLAERGLGPAIAALAAPQPGAGDRAPSTSRTSLPPAVETAAWFVVSEALANTAKHSGAAARRGVAHPARRATCTSRSSTTAAAAPTPPAPACAGSRSGSRRSTARWRSTARPAGRRWSERSSRARSHRRGPRAAARRPGAPAARQRLRRRRRRRRRRRAARRRRASTGPTWRSSTCGSRRRSATRACAPRSSCAAAAPASRS